MDRSRLGFLLIAAAPAAWIVGAIGVGQRDYILPLAVVLVGTGLAAWAVPAGRRIIGAVAIIVVALGMGVFYDFDLFSDLEHRGAGIILLGLGISAISVIADTPRGLAAGLIVIAAGAALWIYVDGTDWEWQPGNLLLLAGALVGAVEAWRHG